MKLTVTQWTNVQTKINDDSEASALYDKIERRTVGKRWSSGVAIKLNKREQEIVDDCLAKLASEEE